MTSVNFKPNQSTDSDVDRYLKESSKSYKGCSIKNHARRNSLQRKTLGIESEKRIASVKLSREEKQLRENLRQMNVEKVKNHILHNIRGEPKRNKKEKESIKGPLPIPLEPYPITFCSDSPPPIIDVGEHLERQGRLYAARKGRRESKEFEDLTLPSTRTKTLLSVDDGHTFEPITRRRVYSMSSVRLNRKPGLSSNHSTPKTSPDLRRRALLNPSKKKGSKGSNSSGSRESLGDSVSSLDDLHWVGEPEAIHSVRRPRKTVEEQELESELHRLHVY